jgi:hypothetical protein
MKRDKILIQIGAACLLALPPAIHGQTGKSPTPVKASVGDVTDNRTTGSFFSECKVELKFTGDAAADAGTVRQARVTEALDELGRDLKLSGRRQFAAFVEFQPFQRRPQNRGEVEKSSPQRHGHQVVERRGGIV